MVLRENESTAVPDFLHELNEWDTMRTEEMHLIRKKLETVLKTIGGERLGTYQQKQTIVTTINAALDAMQLCIVCPKTKRTSRLDVQPNEKQGAFRLRESVNGAWQYLSSSRKFFRDLTLRFRVPSKTSTESSVPRAA